MKTIDGVDVDELERRMRPGGWSQEGFLRPEQSLVQVLADDRASIQKLGVSVQQISDALEILLEKGAHSNRFKPEYVGHFKVQIIHSRKMRTCPWAPQQFEWCRFGRGVTYLTTEDFKITNTRIGESLRSTSLCLHLIRDHSFFGGRGTPYRIEPEKAARVLELVSNNK